MDKGFSADWISELKSNNDIISVISKYVNLQKKGKTWWGCCPFHFEKTPSFAVNDYEQYYHCFGCGESGDVIKFLEKIENCDFYDACVILAKNANMKIPEFNNDENLIQTKKKKEIILKILNDAGRYYFKNLNLPQSKVALDYLKKRNLDIATIKTFGIGYSVGWEDVIHYLKGLGYSEKDMLDAGLIEKRSNGNGYYDTQSKRLVFPIINSFGDVVGFSGRILEKTDFAKYKNTAQTLVFDKSKCVYNINNIKKLKQNNELREIILVEGQMDVISLFKNGVKNAVASLGTALTANHAKELKKFCDKVVVCFDGDGAGIKATLRSIEILLKAGLEVYVASLPVGVDPDEFIIKFGKVEFDNIIDNAKFWVEFLITNYASSYNLSKSEEKTKFISDALNVVKELKTESEQEIYLKMINSLSGISISVLKNDLHNANSTNVVSEPEVKQNAYDIRKDNAYIKAVKFIMASLLHKKEYAVLNDDIKNNLLNNDYITLYQFIEEKEKSGEKLLVSSVFDMFDADSNCDIYDIINYNFNETEEISEYYKDCVKNIKMAGLSKRQQAIMAKISNCDNEDEKRALRKELQEIIIKMKDK